jgi:hypothetical protein
MKKPPLWQMKIPATKSKREYLELIEEMRERWDRQLEARELNIRIKEMQAHMRGTELEQEEDFREREEALKKREDELLACERELGERMKKSHNDY